MPNTWADAVEQIAARCLACHSRWEFRSGCPAPHVRQTKRASKIVLRIGAESRELARVGEELADRSSALSSSMVLGRCPISAVESYRFAPPPLAPAAFATGDHAEKTREKIWANISQRI